jgi:hypothetical protein
VLPEGAETGEGEGGGVKEHTPQPKVRDRPDCSLTAFAVRLKARYVSFPAYPPWRHPVT